MNVQRVVCLNCARPLDQECTLGTIVTLSRKQIA